MAEKRGEGVRVEARVGPRCETAPHLGSRHQTRGRAPLGPQRRPVGQVLVGTGLPRGARTAVDPVPSHGARRGVRALVRGDAVRAIRRVRAQVGEQRGVVLAGRVEVVVGVLALCGEGDGERGATREGSLLSYSTRGRKLHTEGRGFCESGVSGARVKGGKKYTSWGDVLAMCAGSECLAGAEEQHSRHERTNDACTWGSRRRARGGAGGSGSGRSSSLLFFRLLLIDSGEPLSFVCIAVTFCTTNNPPSPTQRAGGNAPP